MGLHQIRFHVLRSGNLQLVTVMGNYHQPRTTLPPFDLEGFFVDNQLDHLVFYFPAQIVRHKGGVQNDKHLKM